MSDLKPQPRETNKTGEDPNEPRFWSGGKARGLIVGLWGLDKIMCLNLTGYANPKCKR
jgi:hypothetical protein